MSRANRGAAVWGALLVIIGLALLLQNFNLLPANYARWWPVLAVGAGLWVLARGFRDRRGGALIGGMLLSSMGVYWLLQNLGEITDRAFVPVILIALGLGFLLRALALPDRVS